MAEDRSYDWGDTCADEVPDDESDVTISPFDPDTQLQISDIIAKL